LQGRAVKSLGQRRWIQPASQNAGRFAGKTKTWTRVPPFQFDGWEASCQENIRISLGKAEIGVPAIALDNWGIVVRITASGGIMKWFCAYLVLDC
jgi:hypothetical protein